jgi:hypothetical protein
MSRRVDGLFEAARQVEVAAPPPLAAIRSEAGARARRAAQLLAFAVALPLGAAAAAGGWVLKEHVAHRAPAVERPAPKAVHDVHAPAPVEAATPVAAQEDEATRADAFAPGTATNALLGVASTAVRPTTNALSGEHRHAPVTSHAARSTPGDASTTNAFGGEHGPAGDASTANALGGEPPNAGGAATAAMHPSAGGSAPAANAPGRERSSTDVPAPADPRARGRIASTGDAPMASPAPDTEVATPSNGGPAPTSLSEESQLLVSILSALRAQHDAPGALTLIAQYRARFPAGALTTEVTLAAAEAQRATGHTAEALTELDRLKTDFRGGELTVLRAELRAELGRCAEARAELAPVLERLPTALRKRALLTDSSCAAALGARDEAEARLHALEQLE